MDPAVPLLLKEPELMKYCGLIIVVASCFSPLRAQTWQQPVRSEPVVARGAAETEEPQGPQIRNARFLQGPRPEWIWGADNDQRYWLTRSFDLGSISAARLRASVDNEGTIWLNGQKVASGSDWQSPMDVDVTQFLQAGDNLIEAEVENRGGIAAFVLQLVVVDKDGKLTHIVSDDSWRVGTERGETTAAVTIHGTLGDAPWGDVFADSPGPSRVPTGVFEVPPGFRVDRLFTVPKEELGSWVCITFDPQGRLLASDQGDKGICRITPPPPGIPDGQTLVERLDFSNCDVQPTAAQGMLWAFDSLYLSINGGPGSGLYRARDIDGDDQFDECVKLKALRGGGEHGPHSLRLSPDGQRIFLICGNHTDPPFAAGDDVSNDHARSRIPTNWGEDLLLPRMWDANGHARGRMAPGGWIASTDPEGTTWELWSIGYRNPYDMAFNADGDLFAFDADMEWDMGLPWYRPTRVVHATSGSEFGWRSGSGKWPAYYPDSLPPLVNVGPGSPVGVDFGYGLDCPVKYQRALYICDWTFGTMYAIHLQPHLSSYMATREEFLSRTPLPLTDVAAGPDGALYFTIGGRGTQSELFRAVWTGETPATSAELQQVADNPHHRLRRRFESLHGGGASADDFLTLRDEARAAGLPLDEAVHAERADDPFLWSALRRAFYGPQAAPALIEMLDGAADTADASAPRPHVVFQIVITLARGLERNGLERTAVRTTALRALETIPFAELTPENQLDYLRALGLLLIRTTEIAEEPVAEPSDGRLPIPNADCSGIRDRLAAAFPSGEPRVDRELCQTLVYLDAPSVVPRTIALLNEPPAPTVPEGMDDLIARNRGYGRSIAAMRANAPDQQQVWYAYCLRVADVGWTRELRAGYFRWCGRAKQWSGGNSYRKFIQNIEDELWAATPENDRVLLEAMEARTPFRMPELPQPAGPGHDWTLDEVRALIEEDGLKNRDFENGETMFAATRCILCHRFAGDGGATGPDLTQLAGRFNVRDLTEAILTPSKVISDQYRGSTIVTTDGRTIAGRIVSENPVQISVLTDPEDSSKIEDIPRSAIEDVLPSQVSIMPKNLLKPLNRDEVLDLLAYLLSRGDPRSPMFRR